MTEERATPATPSCAVQGPPAVCSPAPVCMCACARARVWACVGMRVCVCALCGAGEAFTYLGPRGPPFIPTCRPVHAQVPAQIPRYRETLP